MRKISYLLLVTAIVFSACKDESFKKGEDGIEYRIIADGKGEALKPGDYIEFQLKSTLSSGKKDSVMNNSRESGGAQIILFDTMNLPPAYVKIFKQMKKGDSLVTKVLTDSVFKKQPGVMPPFMKKGDWLYTHLKITNVYKTKEEADKAREVIMAAQEIAAKAKAADLVIKDDKTLTDYFSKNNVKAVKTPLGAYVETVQPGTGAMLDTSVFAKINYTGRILGGTMFDSNTDPSKGHVQPLIVNLTNDMTIPGGVIPGLADALKTLNKGAKAKIYIPSAIGYGPGGMGADIAPNSNLVFEVEILDILTKAQAKAEFDAEGKKLEAMQKRYADSVAKAQPAAPATK